MSKLNEQRPGHTPRVQLRPCPTCGSPMAYRRKSGAFAWIAALSCTNALCTVYMIGDFYGSTGIFGVPESFEGEYNAFCRLAMRWNEEQRRRAAWRSGGILPS